MVVHRLIDAITSDDESVRDQPLEGLIGGLTAADLLRDCDILDGFRRDSTNLYHRVRGLFFLYAIYRFHLPPLLQETSPGHVSYAGFEHLLNRRFPEAIDTFLQQVNDDGASVAVCSALAESYHRLAFQTLADQVRRSVRTVRGNQWMFRTGHPEQTPLRLRPELLNRSGSDYPVLREKTAVRMDFSHSGWSDIFFLGMDYPEGARVINASVNLAVRGRHDRPEPPIDVGLRVIDQPVLRLVSIDLDSVAEIEDLSEVFDFAKDYLGLLKAAVIAAGVIPPGLEGCGGKVADVFERMVGPGLGLEIVSRVNDIPKGSRLAVSTNLLGSLISVCMRATRQVSELTGPLQESDRRIVAARAILGEWIGGSGGGWQDSGGVWPGIKLIQGTTAGEGDPEYGISRGRLLPTHHVFTADEVTAETRDKLQDSLVLVHGGMAQNVGPVLEMVTEKYLLRSRAEWEARQDAIRLFDRMTECLKAGDISGVGRCTHENFHEPLQQIIPWCSNAYTDRLIRDSRERYGDRFFGFWMLGGMAGGGMGFLFAKEVREEAASWLQEHMVAVKRSMEDSVPFAMDPVVYNFELNDSGTASVLLDAEGREISVTSGQSAEETVVAGASRSRVMPKGYYSLMVPGWLRKGLPRLSPQTRRELERVSDRCSSGHDGADLSGRLIGRILPAPAGETREGQGLDELLERHGFDRVAHEQLRDDLKAGRVGLAQNRLHSSATIEDVPLNQLTDVRGGMDDADIAVGRKALESGEAAVMTLAAGVGSRWTQGAGVVKALNPFSRFEGEFRSFLDVHLAKTRHVAEQFGRSPVHIVTTGYMTEEPIRRAVSAMGQVGSIYVSSGCSVGLRTIPMMRDLRFAWEQSPQEVLDEQKQKMRASARSALQQWARGAGEGSDYIDNLPMQCLHPVGHWYEFPNLLRNGLLAQLLEQQPQLQYILLHNIDTLGAALDAGLLGRHIQSGKDLTFEVMARRLEDRGGGLASVDGRVRLVEGLALPREDDEFRLSWYNSMTTWITIDQVLRVFGLDRETLRVPERVEEAIRRLGRRMPTYITLKDVKKRWGHGQEDIFPVAQFEKLWGDMSALPDVDCGFFVVPIPRGQQLKDPAQLDGWMRDGTADYVARLCRW